MLTVNFFAENHQSYEASSFMIDTTPLAGCSANKEVNVVLPYKQNGFGGIKAVAFLNGFEISISGCQPGVTPFEIQILNVAVTSGGVSLKLTVTTSVKVYNAYVSVLAWSMSATSVVGDTYQYNTFAPLSELSSNSIGVSGDPEDRFGMFGFSGFIVSAGQFWLSANLVNNQFAFTTATTFQYLSFGYFFVSVPACSDCPGYPYPYNGVCQANCPPGTYLSNGRCIPVSNQCPPGTYWNGTACCPSTHTPTCPAGTFWNGTACCPVTTNCPLGTYWNGQSCVPQHNCPPGQYWNGTACCSTIPTCPPGTQWNGTACCPINTPPTCPPGSYWNGQSCVSQPSCPPGTKWNGTACCPVVTPPVCPPGTYWNGTACCKSTPSCPPGTKWNGNACVRDDFCPNPPLPPIPPQPPVC